MKPETKKRNKDAIKATLDMFEMMDDNKKTLWDYKQEFELSHKFNNTVKRKCVRINCGKFFTTKKLGKKLCPQCTEEWAGYRELENSKPGILV